MQFHPIINYTKDEMVQAQNNQFIKQMHYTKRERLKNQNRKPSTFLIIDNHSQLNEHPSDWLCALQSEKPALYMHRAHPTYPVHYIWYAASRTPVVASVSQPCDVVVTRLPAKKRCWWCWCWRNPHPRCDMNNIRHAHQFHITERLRHHDHKSVCYTQNAVTYIHNCIICKYYTYIIHNYRPSNVLLYHRTPSSRLPPHIKFNPQLWILILHFHFSLYASLWWCGAAAWIC